MKAFKRVGHWRHTDGRHTKEIKCRVQLAYEALWKIKKRILECRRLPDELKVMFVNALVAARVQFGVEAWAKFSLNDVAALDRPRIRAARSIAGDDQFGLSRVAALQTAGFASLAWIMRHKRLALLSALLNNVWLRAFFNIEGRP